MMACKRNGKQSLQMWFCRLEDKCVQMKLLDVVRKDANLCRSACMQYSTRFILDPSKTQLEKFCDAESQFSMKDEKVVYCGWRATEHVLGSNMKSDICFCEITTHSGTGEATDYRNSTKNSK